MKLESECIEASACIFVCEFLNKYMHVCVCAFLNINFQRKI